MHNDNTTTIEALVTEEAAAEMLGIPLKAVRELRKKYLLPDHGYKKEGGGRVRITAEGMKALANAPSHSEKKDARWEEEDVDMEALVLRDIVVESVPVNPHLVMGRVRFEDGDEQVVRVRVRTNQNFIRGMHLRDCRQVELTLWAFDGACPRFRGRW
jgi:hypothetical protein